MRLSRHHSSAHRLKIGPNRVDGNKPMQSLSIIKEVSPNRFHHSSEDYLKYSKGDILKMKSCLVLCCSFVSIWLEHFETIPVINTHFIRYRHTVFLWRNKMPLVGASQQGHSWVSKHGWKHDYMWYYVTKNVFNSIKGPTEIFGEKFFWKK